MKIIIYTGLSISFDEARKILDNTPHTQVIYKKPIKRGDISLAIQEKADIIGIIDGVFHQTPAVAHKEILEAINKGITVIGSSSMGALRASELDNLGMKGIGYIYNQYTTGQITSDDDVALISDNNTLQPLSTPLISIKYTLSQAAQKKIITNKEKKEPLQIAKQTYYPQRNYPHLLSQSHLNTQKKNKLTQFINKTTDIKKKDAKKLLKYIKKKITTPKTQTTDKNE